MNQITLTVETTLVVGLGGCAAHGYNHEKGCAVVYRAALVGEKPVDVPMTEEEYETHTPYSLMRAARGNE